MATRLMDQEFWKGFNADDYPKADASTGTSAYELIKQAGLKDYTGKDELVIADLGCGDGIVAVYLWKAIGEEGRAKVKSVTCGDINAGMIGNCQKRAGAVGWGDRFSAAVTDTMDNKLPSDHFTHVLMNHSMVMLPDIDKALQESIRIIRPGGTLAFTAWEDVGWIHVLNQALANVGGCELFPQTAIDFFHKMGMKQPWYEKDWVYSRIKEEKDLDPASIQVNVVRCPIQGVTGKEWVVSCLPFLNNVYPMVWGKQVVEKFEKEGKKQLVEQELIRIAEEKWAKDDRAEMVPIVITAKKVA